MRRATVLETLLLDRFPTPIGDMLVVVDASDRLHAIDWFDYEERMHRLLRLHYGAEGTGYRLRQAPLSQTLTKLLSEYFAGRLAALDEMAVATRGTEFQREVWAALRKIPAGSTLSYRELAEFIGRPKAVRAVGLANGANPVGVVVPCHRVIGADASLTGYGGGLHRKRWLLAHEGVELKL